MTKRNEINAITTTQANTIVLRFIPGLWSNRKDKTDTALRTLARDYCRAKNITPKQAIATPLPR